VGILSGEFTVVAAVNDGGSVVTESARLNPDVLVLDISMPDMSGIAAAVRLRAAGFTGKIVFVTMHRERAFVHESSALGLVGYVLKDRLALDLIPAIHHVLAGQSFVSPSFRQ
jgi:DNA-binding NarL/FixJ family response regulator